MCGDVEVADAPPERAPSVDRIGKLEAELARLRQEFEDFRRTFE
jgi:hypothetical protein